MSIWDKYPNFTGQELRTLVALTANMFLETDLAVSPYPKDLLQISPKAAAGELLPLLQASDAGIRKEQIQKVIEDEDLSSQVCLKILGEVRLYPELAERLDQAYELQTRKMVSPELLLLTGALVILAIKVREINWKEGKIIFDKSNKVVQGFLSGLVKTFGGS
jgi:hypothetical protein